MARETSVGSVRPDRSRSLRTVDRIAGQVHVALRRSGPPSAVRVRFVLRPPGHPSCGGSTSSFAPRAAKVLFACRPRVFDFGDQRQEARRGSPVTITPGK